MKASELRLMNLLNYLEETVYVLGVRQNNEYMLPSHNLELGYFVDSVGFERNENDPDIHPIPLTEEWLLKFGFEVYSDYSFRNFRLPENNFFVSMWMEEKPVAGFEETGAVYWSDNYRAIKYVHSLQNLYFALTGKELEIK